MFPGSSKEGVDVTMMELINQGKSEDEGENQLNIAQNGNGNRRNRVQATTAKCIFFA